MTGVFIAIMVVLFGAGGFIVFNSMTPARQREARNRRIMRKLYAFLSRFFLTQFHLSKIYGKLANLSLYKRDELQALSVSYLLKSWGAGGTMILLGIVVFEDILTILICVLFALILTNIIIDKQLDKMLFKVQKGLKEVLTSLREEYMKTNSVVEALNDSDTPDIVKRPIDEITSILVSTNSELKLQEFSESTPFRPLQTLAGICYHVNNQGDDKDSHGQSNFISALTLMISDLNSEMQKVFYRKKTFGIIEYLPLVPLPAIYIIETFFVKLMPGTALIYHGPLGYRFKIVIVLLSMISYTIVSRINSSVPIKEDDRGDWVIGALEKKRLRNFIYNLTPKNKARAQMETKLKHALSRMTVEQFYLKKVVFGVFLFSLTLLGSITTVSLGKEYIQDSTQQLSLVATNEMESFTEEAIRTLDGIYLKNPEKYERVEDATALVQTYMPGLSDLQLQDQVKRLKDKKKNIDNAYFKWWFVWVAVAMGLIGWFAPNMNLMLRKILIQTEEEDDFLQLQTLVSILMNTNMDTLDILGEMAQHTRVHKDMFEYAYQGYPSNPELEIARLQAKTPLIDFKRFIGKLNLTISDLSLREAYSDLLLERENILRIREMTIRSSINTKRMYCGPLSLVPLGAVIILMFLVPVGILGYNEFMNALGAMKG